MKKVGFIDYYLDEWHANNYPALIKEHSQGRYEVAYAYGTIEPKNEQLRKNKKWAEDYGIELLDTIEEVIEKSDVLIVLSPDNPEMHEELCALPLASGKLTYIDKTFAPDRATAERIFAVAEAHNTSCYSSSALRFATEVMEFDRSSIRAVYSEGPGTMEMYSIHQIEPIVSLMQCRAKDVMYIGDSAAPSLIIRFEDGKIAHMRQCVNTDFRFTTVDANAKADVRPVESDYFGNFIDSLIEFFDTGVAPVPHSQTIDVIAIRDTGLRARSTPYTWLEV